MARDLPPGRALGQMLNDALRSLPLGNLCDRPHRVLSSPTFCSEPWARACSLSCYRVRWPTPRTSTCFLLPHRPATLRHCSLAPRWREGARTVGSTKE